MQITKFAQDIFVSDRFQDLAGVIGGDLALFCVCAVFNLPVYTDKPVKDWESYLERMEKEKNQAGFADGETDIDVVRVHGLSESERWEKDWGIGNPDSPYMPQDYKRLDELFRTFSARLEAAGGYDAQQEDTLRNCCVMRLQADKAINRGDKESVDIAAKLNKMIQDNLSSENLRRKDAKPVETAKVDGIIDAMQRKYGISAEMTKDQFLEVFFKWCHSHSYPETVDAADHAMLAIINTMRSNADLPELPELPESASFEPYESEFAVIPNEAEETTYEYLGLKRKERNGKT